MRRGENQTGGIAAAGASGNFGLIPWVSYEVRFLFGFSCKA
jgi:hypothetical protein